MNKTKKMIRNFLVFPAVIYVVLIYLYWLGVHNDTTSISKVMVYWGNYTELLKFYTTNNLDFVLFSNYFSSYSLLLDPAKLFFYHTIPINLMIDFPMLIPILYLLPLSYIPILVMHRKKRIYKEFFWGAMIYFFFLVFHVMTYDKGGLNYNLMKSVQEVRLDIEWYNNSGMVTQFVGSSFIRKTRTRDYIESALSYEKQHKLLLSWYFLQKAKQSGLYFEDIDKNIDRIELALLREYKIHKFYQFLPKQL